MDIRCFRPAALVACALLALMGCGGGGSGGGGNEPKYPLTVSLSQNPITMSIAQMELPAPVTVTASVQGSTSASTFYVIIADPTGTFTNVSSLSQVSANQYRADLTRADARSGAPCSIPFPPARSVVV